MNRSTIRLRLVPAALLISVALVGCGGGSSNSDDSSVAPDSSVLTDQTTASANTPNDTAVVATVAPVTSDAPAVTSSPGATLADPPVSNSIPIMTLAPGVSISLPPTITSLTAQTSWTCVQALAAGSKVVVSWTAANAVQVSVQGPGLKQAVKRDPNDQEGFSLVCGESTVVRVTPLGTNGVQGVQKSITITVGPPLVIPIQP